MALLDPAAASPDPGELADFDTSDDVLWEAYSGGLVYQEGSAPAGTNPAILAKE